MNVAAREVSPSSERPIRPGERLDVSGFERAQRPWTLQKLGDGAWWVEVRNYQATVLTGGGAVLVIDPLSGGRGEALMAAIRHLTAEPVQMLVYSHHHADHLGDAAVVAAANPGLEIIATAACARELERHEVDVPPPTAILDDEGVLSWNGRQIEYGLAPGHCPDNTWFLVRDCGVLHCVDMIHPGGLEFESFGLAEDLWLYERSLERLDRLEWELLVAGHREIGYRSDLEAARAYVAELRTHAAAAARRFPPAEFARTDAPPHNWPAERQSAVVEAIVAEMAGNWGDWPGFAELCPSHARSMYHDVEYFGSGGRRL